MNDIEIPRFVTLSEAGAILGGKKPYSTKTIQRLIAAGRLVAFGERAGRRVIGRSLRVLMAELEEGKPLWPAKSAPVANTDVALPTKPKRASGSRRSRSATGESPSVVLLTNKRGMRGARR